MAFTGSIQDLQRAEVVDSTGTKVGNVGQVYLTNDSQEPSWVTVNTGLFGTKETFIPLAEATFSGDAITVPYEKSFIKDAPHVDEDGEISAQQEEELYRYYGVADDRGTAATGRGTDRDGLGDRDAALAGTAGTGVGTDRDRDLDRDRDGLGDRDRDAALAGTAGTGVGTDRDRDLDRDRAGKDADGVTLHEEKVEVGTERQQTGKARLRKYVVTETEQVEVPVQREEVVLEREPATGRDAGRVGEEEVEVTLSEERPVINKETVATENVSLGKRTVEDTETVRTEVAHEEVDVDGVQNARTDADRDGRDRI